jgi:hypothetical protein
VGAINSATNPELGFYTRGAMEVEEISAKNDFTFGYLLRDVGRCPHCQIASPRMNRVWSSDGPTERDDGGAPLYWGAFQCATCGGIAALSAQTGSYGFVNLEMFPATKEAHRDIPDVARTFLQQAFNTQSSPDAATLMAASSIDAMLKWIGYQEGSLYSRIDVALADNVLTKGMADWAHAVRLDANSVRHADKAKPNATFDEAKQAVEFAEALGNFLFVLTAKIERGIEAANRAESGTSE